MVLIVKVTRILIMFSKDHATSSSLILKKICDSQVHKALNLCIVQKMINNYTVSRVG
jgi:hypothetical protein